MATLLAKRIGAKITVLVFGSVQVIAFTNCSSDSTHPTSPHETADSGHPRAHVDAGAHVGPDAHVSADAGADAALDPFTGDCTTARWGPTTNECWSCLCNTCKDSLNACGPDCSKAVQCASKKHTLVGVAADIQCELRAFTAECLQDPAAAAASNQLLAFDTCLIDSHKPTEHLRACEVECGTVYTGDVCARFPAPDQ